MCFLPNWGWTIAHLLFSWKGSFDFWKHAWSQPASDRRISVVASLPSLFFGGREATTGNASAVRRLALSWLQDDNMIVENLKKEDTIFDKFDVKEVNQSQFTTWEVLRSLVTKCQKGIPSLRWFISRTRRIHQHWTLYCQEKGPS